MTAADQRYLIIGGQPKAGTTSLYDWLAVHPDIRASRLKEVRFFLDTDYPLPSTYRFNGRNIEAYEKLFQGEEGRAGKICLDATPDYLYSTNAKHIARVLPQSRIVFIVRDPVERMLSWYKFARQRGMLVGNISFNDYVEMQFNRPLTPSTPTHLRALDQCRIGHYLPGFQEAFGERCLVLDFAGMKSKPAAVVDKVCAFAGLNPTIYREYSFKAKNVSTGSAGGRFNALYCGIRSRIAYSINPSSRVRNAIRPINSLLKRALLSSGKLMDEIHVMEETRRLINEVAES